MTLEDINYSKLFLKTKTKQTKVRNYEKAEAGYDSMSWRLFSAVNYLHENLL